MSKKTFYWKLNPENKTLMVIMSERAFPLRFFLKFFLVCKGKVNVTLQKRCFVKPISNKKTFWSIAVSQCYAMDGSVERKVNKRIMRDCSISIWKNTVWGNQYSLGKYSLGKYSLGKYDFGKYGLRNTVWENTVLGKYGLGKYGLGNTVWENTVWKNTVWENTVWKNIV